MISRYNVYLNDVPLSTLNDMLYISDISYNPASPERYTQRLVGRNGAYSGSEYIEDNRITVSFMLRVYNTQQRQSAMQTVIGWCVPGGWLKTSDRPDQRIYVRCTKLPSVNSVMKWTDTVSIEFTAIDYPFWTDEIPQKVEMTPGNDYSVFVPGVYKTDVEAVIVPTEAISSCTIGCGDTYIELADMDIPAGQEITISYLPEHHILQIESDGVSLLDFRTPESNDDLVMSPGVNYASFEADGDAVCTLLVRGVWL